MVNRYYKETSDKTFFTWTGMGGAPVWEKMEDSNWSDELSPYCEGSEEDFIRALSDEDGEIEESTGHGAR